MEKTFACNHGMMTWRLLAETCVRTVRLDRLLWIRALTRRAAQTASLALESVLSPATHVLRVWVMCRSAVICTTSVEATASGFRLVFPSQSGPRVHYGDPRGIRVVVLFGDVSNGTFPSSGTCPEAYEMSSSGQRHVGEGRWAFRNVLLGLGFTARWQFEARNATVSRKRSTEKAEGQTERDQAMYDGRTERRDFDDVC